MLFLHGNRLGLITLTFCRENFFKDVGQVVDVRFSCDQDGRFKGFGHVEFATAEEAQKVYLCFGWGLLIGAIL